MKPKHGAWLVEFAENGWNDTICSVCGWTWNDDVHVHLNFRYCPNCGAFMDLTGGEERKRIYDEGGKMKERLEHYKELYN